MVWFKNGNLDTKDGDSITEGIGLTRVTKNVEGISVDEAYRIEDQTALTIVHHLLRDEGLFTGLSTGVNIARSGHVSPANAAPGQIIATILCDSGVRYQSKIFNREWLQTRNLNPDLPLESVLQ